MNQSRADFSFFVPATIEKAKNANGVEEMRIRGIANSDRSRDSDGEVLEPIGFDYDPLLRTGFLNWDHQAKKTSAAIVGEPTMAKVINDGRDFYIEGILYPDSEEARSIYKLAQVLEKNSKTRRLGFSIEGQVIERGCGPEFLDKERTLRNPDYTPEKWNRIVKARITGVAITPCPKNPNTYLEIAKGQTSHPLMGVEYDEDVVKAMEVDQQLTQHDVMPEVKIKDSLSSKGGSTCPKCDHDQLIDGKCLECGYKEAVGKSVRKSEIYNLIAKRYTNSVEKAEQIFSLIESVNQKLFNMTDKTISREAVEKAFRFLDEALLQKSATEEAALLNEEAAANEEQELEKGEKPNEEAPEMKQEGAEEKGLATKEGTEDEAGEDDDEDEEFEKAKEMCKGLLAKGLTKGQVIDELEKSGHDLVVAAAACSACIADASANKDGGKVAVVSAPIVKGEESETLSVEKDTTPELLKSLSAQIGDKFSALGNILKHTVEQDDILKSQIETLSKKLEAIENDLNQPMTRKSIVKAKAIERFDDNGAKKEPALAEGAEVYDLAKSEDVSALGERLFAEHAVARQNGHTQVAAVFERAIGDLEITKSLPSAILPYLKAKNIVIRSVR